MSMDQAFLLMVISFSQTCLEVPSECCGKSLIGYQNEYQVRQKFSEYAIFEPYLIQSYSHSASLQLL
jgi:hypothetical protein